MAPGLSTALGEVRLRSPLIASSGTVGSVWEWAEVADVSAYGAAVAKSVAPEPWPGRQPPRVAPTRAGMLNGIGIQNPGIDAWVAETAPKLAPLDVDVWGSAVAHDVEGFALVAKRLEAAGVKTVEVNLSCPNLDTGDLFSFDAELSREVMSAVAGAVSIPVGAKLSPNTPDIVGVAEACVVAGADFLILTNTALGYGIDLATAKPLLSGGVGGYSGPGLKPIALRCVFEVASALENTPIVGCGGVMSGSDVVEYMLAGASAVQAGTVHMAEPDAGRRIVRELKKVLERLGVSEVSELVGAVNSW